MPSAKAWASTPNPILSSDTEHLGQLAERGDAEGSGRRLVQMTPGAATDVHGDHPCGEGRLDVVVDPVADIGDLLSRDAALGDDPLEERGRGFLDSPARRRADEIDVVAEQVLRIRERVADGAGAGCASA